MHRRGLRKDCQELIQKMIFISRSGYAEKNMITDEEFYKIDDYDKVKIILKNGIVLIGQPSFIDKEDCENELYDYYAMFGSYSYPIYQKDIVSVEFLEERTWDEDDEEE